MLKLLVGALAMVLAGPAWAEGEFNGKDAAGTWYAVHTMCYQAETPFAWRAVSADVSAAACVVRDDLGKDLVAHGWCFDKSEQVWATRCPVEN